jgi:hypothetical protein
MAMIRALLFGAFAFVVTGCVRKPLHPPVAQEDWPPDFLDLEAGWRLKVTTPLLSTGKYQIQAIEEQSSGNTITLSTGDQSIAYEVAFYRVQSQGGGVRLETISAEMFKDGQALKEPAPRGWHPQLPANPVLMRLVYLRRLSEHDHDMAFIAAHDKSELDTLTRRVQIEHECTAGCLWIPAGVAVVAERQLNAETGSAWEPVR